MPEATQLVSGRARVPSLLAPSPTLSPSHHSCLSRGRVGGAPRPGWARRGWDLDRCAMTGAREAVGGGGRWIKGWRAFWRASVPKEKAGGESRRLDAPESVCLASPAARHQRTGWGKEKGSQYGSLDGPVFRSCLCHRPAVWPQISNATLSASVPSL